MTHTTNYTDTFISVADDCPVEEGAAPPVRTVRSTAQAQYEMLQNNPYVYTSDDVLFETLGKPKGQSREQFFSKGQPCFRSSALTKRYGWGVHSDKEGKIALYALGSIEYQRLSCSPEVTQLKAIRSKRAK